MEAIWLYWFAAQQQTSQAKQQNLSPFYRKFKAEFNEVSLDY